MVGYTLFIYIIAFFICFMKKLSVLCSVLFLTLGFLACSSDEDQTKVYNYDELPAWLVPQAQEMTEEFKGIDMDPSLLFGISRATGVHGETVYHIWRAYDSCWMCNLYDEKGNSIDYADAFGEDVVAGNEGWVVIFPKTK